ncbi:ATP-binding protein [Brevibacillus choshinensis]|uniref:ATP-binding protein n=1 Tax=Brevibacillus choshinensis TaxID=54911 RepID=UPI002E227D63|nr:AAA family ATPase [Brevibacillus choshinensis]MED4784107.1 AAA family ATPase [Brevibacillus choshinensis]
MRMDELQLKGFGKWQDASFRFAPGINVFAAPNEAGKSTLLQGIFAALYGMKRDYVKGARYLPEYEKYRPWHQGDYETIITYHLGGKSYRLHRFLQKEREQARIFLDSEWTELTDIYMEDRRKERDFLEKHLGLTRSLFTDITWIRREPLSAAEHLMPSLARTDEANPAVNNMLAELDRDLTAIGKKERAENTLLGKAGALVAQKEAELSNAESAWRIISQLTQQIADWELERQELDQQRNRLQQRKQRVSTRELAWQERWQKSYSVPADADVWDWWERTATSLEEKQIHGEAMAALTRVLASPSEETVEILSTFDREKLQADYAKGVQLRKRWEEAHLQLAKLAASTMNAGARRQDRHMEGQKKQQRYPVWMWGSAGLLAVIGFISGVTDQTALSVILLVLTAVVAGMAWIKTRSVAKAGGQSPGTPATTDLATQAWQRQQEELSALDVELHQLIVAWGVDDWEAFAEKRDALLNSLISRESSQLKAQLSQKQEEEQVITRWGERLRTVLEQEKTVLESEQGAWRTEWQHIEERMQHIREQIARATGEVAAHDTVSLAKAKGEYDEAVAGLRQLQQKRESLQVARDTLQEALAEWNRDVSPGVNEQASHVLGRITGGAYRDVRLDPHERFAIRVMEPSRQLVLEQEQCSTGTQDQLYLSQRLALHQHVSQQSEPLPLFFDDHFVHYDEARLQRTLEYVVERSQEHQIFLFTCQEREKKILEPLLGVSNRHLVHTLG